MLLRWLLFGWLPLTFSLNKTPSGEAGCLSNPYFLLTGCLGIQFFDSSHSQHSRLGYLWLHTPHCKAPVLLTRHYSTPLVIRHFPPNHYLWKESISLGGDKYFKHVPLLTYLIYFSPKGVYMVGLTYVIESPYRTLISLSLVLNQCFKKTMC